MSVVGPRSTLPTRGAAASRSGVAGGVAGDSEQRPSASPDERLEAPSDARDGAAPGLLVIGHGSRDETGVEELRAFVEAVRANRPAIDVELGIIEFARPDLDEALDALVARAPRGVVAVPLVLFGAGHMKDDGPEALARARMRHPSVRFWYAGALSIHPSVLAVAEERIREAGGAAADAVVVVGRGSTDPDANADLAKIARLLADRRGLGVGSDPAKTLGLVEEAFVSLAEPSVPEALERCVALGARSVAVVPYFLFTGVLVERIADQARRFAAEHPGVTVRVGRHLGVDARLVELVWHRYDQALAGAVQVSCDCCVYRAPLPGYEQRARAPIGARRDANAPWVHPRPKSPDPQR
jgi:sirohydrochlorin ferrochelatase